MYKELISNLAMAACRDKDFDEPWCLEVTNFKYSDFKETRLAENENYQDNALSHDFISYVMHVAESRASEMIMWIIVAKKSLRISNIELFNWLYNKKTKFTEETETYRKKLFRIAQAKAIDCSYCDTFPYFVYELILTDETSGEITDAVNGYFFYKSALNCIEETIEKIMKE